jgi:predicted HTH domain antitoxin
MGVLHPCAHNAARILASERPNQDQQLTQGAIAMATQKVDVPEEILALFQASRLATRPVSDQVKAALATHLFLEGLISIGKAAELAGEPRLKFEWLLSQMGLPVVTYDVPDYEEDLQAFSQAERRPAS